MTTFPSGVISHGSPLVLHELGIVEVRTQGLEGLVPSSSAPISRE